MQEKTISYPSPLPLPDSPKYIPVPRDVIVHGDPRVLAAYIYLCIKRGMDNQVDVFIDNMARWYGLMPNKKTGKINEGFVSAIHELSKMGYIEILGEDILRGMTVEYYLLVSPFHTDGENTSQRFAQVFFDELSTILSHFRNCRTDIHIFTLLKVFAYLRMQLKAERDINTNGYSESYSSISKSIGVSKNSVAKAIQVLSCNGKYGTQECVENSLIPVFYVDHPVVMDGSENNVKRTPTVFRPCYNIRIDRDKNETIKTGLSPPKSL